MATLLKSGGVFLHIPKTGGSWVQEVLKELGLVRYNIGREHEDMPSIMHFPLANPYEYRRKLISRGLGWHGDVVRGFKFCFTRNPLTWYESYWKWRAGQWPEGPDYYTDFPVGTIAETGDDNFNTFVRNVIERFPGYVTALYGRYAVPGLIDFIGKQETLTDDLIAVLTHLNENFDEDRIRNWPRVNASQSKFGKPVWNPSVRDLACKAEYAGILRYGYEVDHLVPTAVMAEVFEPVASPRHAKLPQSRVIRKPLLGGNGYQVPVGS